MLVPPDDPSSIVAAIRRLHEDAALRNGIGLAAMSLSKDFEWQVIANQTTNFFAEVLMRH
jgi:glycosyltransferase involved in cell wall biosynthesis